ncbi:MAG TPA: sulfatase-like hydrolase/transferase [Candidatus Binatia bacterium]|jgi:hypothetical protein|nr:sulfatase-like hydrolase/transferase [Candidatus Binatia bacterium]
MRLRPESIVVWLMLVLSSVLLRDADAAVSFKKDFFGCEPPSVFYSSRHLAGRPPCCATVPGRCEGQDVCPETGVCPSGKACTPEAGPARPNIILFIADDVGSCHYGFEGECRSAQTGTPIVAPQTPNLDALAGSGTVFPIAHNAAAWCYPSLNTLLTGRFQRSFNGQRSRLGETFATVPRQLRSLGGGPDIPKDPYDDTAATGGYCTYLGGKFTGSAGEPGFDGGDRGAGARLGRLFCSAGPDTGDAPRCGSQRSTTYDPLQVVHMRELFQFVDAMIYPKADAPGAYGVKPWFAWYAPRIPHQPLRAPLEIEQYLFGSDANHRGGLFDLGRFCTGSLCPPSVNAFEEINFGTVREFYASVWWMDDNVREIREFLDHASQPHCIGRNGEGRYEVATPGACNGTWATSIAPDMARNTIIMQLADNGWHLPNSKHHFAENGYRTQLIVYDPRTLAEPPSWRASDVPPVQPYRSPAVVHSSDVLPTLLGFALDAPEPIECPASEDGSRCDGRDLRKHLITNPGGPAPAENLRHALCGHHTQRATKPSRQRYMLTRPESVGRCVPAGAPSCASTTDCAQGSACIAGSCIVTSTGSCTTAAQCQSGAMCVAGKCRVAPTCLDDSTCADLLPDQDATCGAKGQGWCRNAPDQTCGASSDCPVCPTVNGIEVPCGRVCAPRLLKLYLSTGGAPELVDLSLDPDEVGRFTGPNDAAKITIQQMSSVTGPYGKTVRNMNCCIDDWWADGARGGTLCSGEAACPADLVCNK